MGIIFIGSRINSQLLDYICVCCICCTFWHQVTYNVNGFLDKNNDPLFRDLSQAMFQCEHPLLQQLFPEGRCDGFTHSILFMIVWYTLYLYVVHLNRFLQTFVFVTLIDRIFFWIGKSC